MNFGGTNQYLGSNMCGGASRIRRDGVGGIDTGLVTVLVLRGKSRQVTV